MAELNTSPQSFEDSLKTFVPPGMSWIRTGVLYFGENLEEIQEEALALCDELAQYHNPDQVVAWVLSVIGLTHESLHDYQEGGKPR